MEKELNAIVSHRVEVASGLIILRIIPDGWELPEWKSGQFAVLGLPESASRTLLADAEEERPASNNIIQRAYSIASSPEEGGYLEFYITLVQSGALTPRLFALQPGDRVFLNKKITGMFTLDNVPDDKHLILVATGTGLAPYMSMLRSGLDCRPDHHTIVLLGARHSWDLGYRGELIAMARYCPTFHYIPVISRPQEELLDWGGKVGYIQHLWEAGLVHDILGTDPTPENTDMLLCGNPGMIEEMLERLNSVGFVKHTKKQAGQLHVEKYW
jgi:ferredoxin--NADP+ reductase